MVSVAKPFSMQTYIHLLTPVNWGQTSNLTCGQPSWMSAIAKNHKKILIWLNYLELTTK